LKKIIISIVFIFQSCFVLANENCPDYPLNIAKGLQLFSGVGSNTARSHQQALVHIQQSLFESRIETQFISESQNGTFNYQTNKQVLVDGKVSGINHVLHLLCDKGYITYLIFDDRTLEAKLANFFETTPAKLIGPLYLLNSKFLKKYNNLNEEKLLEVKLSKGKNKENYLLVGVVQFKLTADELNQLLAGLLTKNQSSISLFYKSSYENQLVINSDKSDSFSIFICNLDTLCQLLSSNQTSEQAFSLLGKDKHFNKENQYFIFAIKKRLIDKVAFYEIKVQRNWFFTFLELTECYPTKSFIKVITIGNF